MKIQKCEHIEHFSDGIPCNIYYIEIEVDNVKEHAVELISIIKDNSWINELNPISRMSYQYKVESTANKLEELFKNPINDSANKLSEDFGEYMISLDSAESLKQSLQHKIFPIAELWKEKITGNHGFDFHTESPERMIAFGEAKYRSTGNAYGIAANQVKDFIADKVRKDLGDASDLNNLGATKEALENLANNKRDFVLAYSVNSDNKELIKQNCLSNETVKFLNTEAQTLYLIGVHII